MQRLLCFFISIILYLGNLSAQIEQPHILWITIEDTSPKFIGCYGDENAWAPTLLDIAGVGIPDDIQGESFLNILKTDGQANELREATYYHYYEFPQPHHVYPHFGMRTARYKLIRFYGPKDFWELYDLEKDPNELINQYGKASYEEISQTLLKHLKASIEKYKDTDARNILRKEEANISTND